MKEKNTDLYSQTKYWLKELCIDFEPSFDSDKGLSSLSSLNQRHLSLLEDWAAVSGKEAADLVLLKSCYMTTISGNAVSAQELCDHFSINLSFIPDISARLDKLVQQKFLIRFRKDSKYVYKVSARFLDRKQQLVELSAGQVHWTLDDALDFAEQVLNAFTNQFISRKDAIELLYLLEGCCKDNSTFTCIQELNLSGKEKLVFFRLLVESDGGGANFDVQSWIQCSFQKVKDRVTLRQRFLNEKSDLFTNNIIQLNEASPFGSTTIALTAFAIQRLFQLPPEQGTAAGFTPLRLKWIKKENINYKSMFYPAATDRQVQQLEKLLAPEKLELFTKRMKGKHTTSGVSILLYGLPGTGKTESVFQLARLTGRDVLMADISSIRQKYVGESEKQLKALFKEYRDAQQQLTPTPILLFNEADAIFNRRLDAERSTDIMNNSLQNILLQELEDFQGILMATTNLQKSFDSAFERRFLFKVEFGLPDAQTMGFLLLDRFPQLNVEEVMLLAAEYRLSAGQLDNVEQKAALLELLENREITLKIIKELMNTETWNQSDVRTPIGFKANAA